ncbi:MAG TPA: hypothetical protein VGR26_10170 [Acidimicrobiales bacterium]|nr:hypothetical protein [Acidimicrobiales bacterium]
MRRYLSAVEIARPGKGTKRTSDAIGNRITKVDEMLVSADPLRRVHLTQERIELHAEYVRVTNGNAPDQSQLQRDFIRVARSYGDRNGITYAAWRQCGVDAEVLERAGVHKADKKPPPAAVRAAAEQTAQAAPTPDPPETKAGEAVDVREPAPTTSEPAGSLEEPDSQPADAVSMEELAALLADASAGSSRTTSTQPRLGDALEAGGNAPAARRSARPTTEGKTGT